MRDKYDVIIIGGGVTGTLALRALSKWDLKLLLLEAGSDIASGATRANSAVMHAGYDPEPGTLKARLNKRGTELYPELCGKLAVKYIPTPSVVAAYSEEDRGTVEKLYSRGLENGVDGLSVIERDALRAAEPNISDSAVCALLASSSALLEPWAIAAAAAETSADNGAELLTDSRVTSIVRKNGFYSVFCGENEYRAAAVINAAGVNADLIHNMAAPPEFRIIPRKGHYIVLDRGARGLVRNILFPCPTKNGKGMLILPEIHGRLLLGPDAASQDEREDVSTAEEGIALVKRTVRDYLRVPIPYGLMIRSFAGVRPTPDTGDFIIRECRSAPGFIDAAGIESPGLASAPAIAEMLEKLTLDILGGAAARKGYVSKRRPAGSYPDSMRSNIVCRCEKVSEADIVDSVHRNCGVRTVKGVKLRTGAGFGGCQSGFCQPKVVDILARELGIDKSEVRYDGPGSEILVSKNRS